ncbi:MAG: phosphatase PAP2-related protein [Deltaproteobacteria bacterium]
MHPSHQSTVLDSARAPVWLRIAFVAMGLAAWFGSQALIGKRSFPDGTIGDAVHLWTAPLHDYLIDHPLAGNALLITSSAVVDLVGVSLLCLAIFGPSVRPFLGLLMLFVLRQSCQGLCSLPAPDEMIWHKTSIPTLLVTYGVSTNLFFSGHTGLAVLGAVELARTKNRFLLILGICIAVFEAATVLILRAHYTMDVFTGAVTALLVSQVAATLAPRCDAFMARWAKPAHSSG